MTVPGYFELSDIWPIVAPMVWLLGLGLLLFTPRFLRFWRLRDHRNVTQRRIHLMAISMVVLMAVLFVLLGSAWLWSDA